MNASPKRVMIVEDSIVVRTLLEHLIGGDNRFQLIASVASAEAALDALEKSRPDVISLDIRLPGMNGLEFTRRVMRTRPTPIVVVSSNIQGDDLNIAMNALLAGALAVLEKPPSPTNEAYARLAPKFLTQLLLMSEVRVIRQYQPSRRPAIRALRFGAVPTGGYRAVGIVASTGGPGALVRVLNGLGADFPLPLFVVQHITAEFLSAFVTWLGRMTPQRVLEAKQDMDYHPGVVHVAPPARHMELCSGHIRLTGSGHEEYQKPSGSVLLRSLAREFGGRSIGVVLTGMGRDGASGLRQIREAGGLTIAEHQSTSVVFGMPAAAVAMNAADRILPLHDIAPFLRATVTGRNTHAG